MQQIYGKEEIIPINANTKNTQMMTTYTKP